MNKRKPQQLARKRRRNSQTKRGTSYEQIVRGVFQSMVDKSAAGAISATVRHNETLTGRSGCAHQIDVTWEIDDPVPYRVIVECKRYNKRLAIGRVRDFFGVIHDLNFLRSTIGVIVTTKGFQRGAGLFANQYGINIKTFSVT